MLNQIFVAGTLCGLFIQLPSVAHTVYEIINKGAKINAFVECEHASIPMAGYDSDSSFVTSLMEDVWCTVDVLPLSTQYATLDIGKIVLKAQTVCKVGVHSDMMGPCWSPVL